MGGSGDLQGLGTSQLYQTQKKKKSHPSLNELTLKIHYKASYNLKEKYRSKLYFIDL